MKHETIRFKSLSLALKELEPFICDGEHLQTGKPFKLFGGLRSREVLANWLLCVAVNSDHPDRLTFTSQPRDVEGDGVILDTATDRTWPTEHILVPRQAGDENVDVEALILKAVEKNWTRVARLMHPARHWWCSAKHRVRHGFRTGLRERSPRDWPLTLCGSWAWSTSGQASTSIR